MSTDACLQKRVNGWGSISTTARSASRTSATFARRVRSSAARSRQRPGRAGSWTRFGRPGNTVGFQVSGGALAAVLGVWLVVTVATRDAGTGVEPAREASAQSREDEAPAAKDKASAGDTQAVVASLRDGTGEVVLNKNGEVSGLPALSRAALDAVAAALSTGRLSVVATTALVPRVSSLRGVEPARGFEVSEPVGRVVESDRPTFRWTAHPSARAYRVAVFDQSFTEVASSGEISATEWEPPSALPRRRILLWQVTAVTPEGPIQAPVPPAAEARFQVLDQAQADELERVRRVEPTSHLALAVLYARAGMQEEATRELTSLAERNPGSALARDLARSVSR